MHHEGALAQPGPGLSQASGENVESGALVPAFWALTGRSCNHSYRFILADLNPVAGDEVRFPSCVNH